MHFEACTKETDSLWEFSPGTPQETSVKESNKSAAVSRLSVQPFHICEADRGRSTLRSSGLSFQYIERSSLYT